MSDNELQFLKRLVALDPGNNELLHRYIAALQRVEPVSTSPSCDVSMLEALENVLDASTTIDPQTKEPLSEDIIRLNSCLERAISHLKTANFFDASVELTRWIALDWGYLTGSDDGLTSVSG